MYLRLLSALVAVTLCGLATSESSPSTGSDAPFNPREYSKRIATCKAVKRDQEKHENVDIHLRYVDVNPSAPKTLFLVHGWPSLWSTWAKQITEFKDEYHLLVPDLRGFAESTHPGDVKTSGTMQDMVSDLVCILEHAKVSSAICVGHDWGSSICYEAARLRPDIFTAVAGAAIPYIPASGPFLPIKHLVPALPKLAYQLFFDGNTPAAIEELDKDIRRTIRGTMRTVASPPPDTFLRSQDSFLDAWSDVEEIPPVPFFTPEEEDYFVEQFSIQGFKHTLQFYTTGNREGTWKFANTQGNHTIPIPVLSLLPLQDPVADWVTATKLLKSEEFLPDLTIEVIDGGHWFHLEYPKEFNAALRSWLEKITAAKETEAPEPRVVDEL